MPFSHSQKNHAVKRAGMHPTQFTVAGAETATMPIMACFLVAACNTDVLQRMTTSLADDLNALQRGNPITSLYEA